MAGIGFRLKKLIAKDDLFSKVGGLVASVFLSSGPWITTILTIGLISSISMKHLGLVEQEKFRIVINYAYAASFIAFSVVEMIIIRYIADLLYLKNSNVIPTLFRSILFTSFILTTVVSSIFFSFTELPWQACVIGVVLFSAITVNWCSMMFLSACKDFVTITLTFILGMLISYLAVQLLGNKFSMGITGFLAGFAAGQIFIASFLSFRIFREFGVVYDQPRDLLDHTKSRFIFVIVGALYGLGAWIDKLVFWFSSNTGQIIDGIFFKSGAYDTAIFLSYLFVVPAMSIFLLQIETRFYSAYRKYFTVIDSKCDYYTIDNVRVEMTRILREDILNLAIIQGSITLSGVLGAKFILELLGLSVSHVIVFQYGIVAATLHVFMLLANILVLYFDLPKIVAKNYFLFFISNGIFSYVTTRMDFQFHGLGYLVASLLVAIISIRDLSNVMKDMNYHIFAKQAVNTFAINNQSLETISLKR